MLKHFTIFHSVYCICFSQKCSLGEHKRLSKKRKEKRVCGFSTKGGPGRKSLGTTGLFYNDVF